MKLPDNVEAGYCEYCGFIMFRLRERYEPQNITTVMGPTNISRPCPYCDSRMGFIPLTDERAVDE